MAWVRIHDAALTHPKLVALIDWSNPFTLWVWGLSYAQQHLTDGKIIKAAIPSTRAASSARKLVESTLWRDSGSYFEIHDYLQWNDSREVVMAKRDGLKARVTRYRHGDSNALPLAHVKHASTSGVGISSNDPTIQNAEGESERKPLAKSAGRQKGRIYLHRWQLDSLIDTLGDLAASFELDVWLDELNTSLVGKVMPRDPWKWVQEQLHAEIAKRGLPTAGAAKFETAEEILRREGVI